MSFLNFKSVTGDGPKSINSNSQVFKMSKRQPLQLQKHSFNFMEKWSVTIRHCSILDNNSHNNAATSSRSEKCNAK